MTDDEIRGLVIKEGQRVLDQAYLAKRRDEQEEEWKTAWLCVVAIAVVGVLLIAASLGAI